MEKTSKTANRCSDDALNHSFPPIPIHKRLKLRRLDTPIDGLWPLLSSLTIHALFFGILSIPAFQIRTSTASQKPTVLWFSSFELPDDNAEFAEMTRAASNIAGEPGTGEVEPDSQPVEQTATDDPSPVFAPEPDTDMENDTAPVEDKFVTTAEHTETGDEMVYPKPVTQQSGPTPSPVPKKVNQPVMPLAPEPEVNSKVSITTSEPAPPPMASLQEETTRALNKIAEENRLAAEKSYQEKIIREQEQRASSEKLKQQQAAAAEKARQEEVQREKLDQERAAQKEALLKQEIARLAMLREQEQLAANERLKQQAAAAEKARQEEARREKLDQERAAQKEALRKQEVARLAMVREQEQRANNEKLKQQQAAAAEKARQEEARREKLDQERAAQKETLRKQEIAHLAMLRDQEQQANNEKLKQQQTAAAEKAWQEEAQRGKLRQEQAAQKEALLKQEIARLEKIKAETSATSGTIAKTSVPKIREIQNDKQVPLKNRDKPISLPIVKGDLKLQVSGAVMPETTITFKEFAVSRRNRPFSRNEARKELKIIPRMVTIKENSREVVIEKATPGVYTFTVAPVGGKTDADFSLVLYEGSSGKINKALGSHSLTTKKVLLKILMPEGILWQDDKAFTGSMEDSSGTTKFNAETGLMWKEYAD